MRLAFVAIIIVVAALTVGSSRGAAQDRPQRAADTTGPTAEVKHSAAATSAQASSPSGQASSGQTVPTDKTDTILAEIRAIRSERKGWTSPDVLLPVVGTLLGAILGAILALLQLKRSNTHQRELAADAAENALALADDAAKHQRLLADDAAKRAADEKHQERLFAALKWFEGKSQPRSIGIAVIEANWATTPSLHPTWTTVLANQAVHLLTVTERRHSHVEFNNLSRIVELLRRPSTDPTTRAFRVHLSPLQQQILLGAFDTAIQNNSLGPQTEGVLGLAVAVSQLAQWKTALKSNMTPATT